jgi:hypothetical protein
MLSGPAEAGIQFRARYPSGKGEVCKTFMRRFDSDPRLQLFQCFQASIRLRVWSSFRFSSARISVKTARTGHETGHAVFTRTSGKSRLKEMGG